MCVVGTDLANKISTKKPEIENATNYKKPPVRAFCIGRTKCQLLSDHSQSCFSAKTQKRIKTAEKLKTANLI